MFESAARGRFSIRAEPKAVGPEPVVGVSAFARCSW